MCGFAGMLGGSWPADQGHEVAERMGATLAHRGPDDAGVWVDATQSIALAHRRLSIIDLSSDGHQPMVSGCGRWILAYNGEVYNFVQLRRELEGLGHGFRGRSDTEVLLAALAHWGVREALPRCNGMFAFALWDRRERRLHLARDRVGKKPLYYGWAGDTLVFGSELKALRAHPQFEGKIDRTALTLFLRYTYVPAPLSIYRGVFKLRQGTVMSLDAEDLGRGPDGFEPERYSQTYWSPVTVAEEGIRAPFRGSDEEAADELDTVLRDAVAGRMIADVPLGAFLSGGIDSSTVVAMMQSQSSRAVRTFSIGFHHEHNEAEHAAAVAKHLGTDHTELYVDGTDTLAVVDLLPDLYDEPYADSSQVPTYIISKLARRHVTVALSGDGGDELFFGYRRYFRGRRIWPVLRSIPLVMRRRLAAAVRGAARGEPGEGRLRNLAADIEAPSPDAMFLNRVSRWKNPAALIVGGSEAPTLFDEVAELDCVAEPNRRMMLLDLVTYLTDDILVKVDRASMGVSLEVRAPLLDHRVVALAFRFPMSLKFRDGTSKWILRRVLARYVPPRLTERPKTGFGSPIRGWLRGALRDWGEALLARQRLEREGFFRPGPVRTMWEENLSGRHKWHNQLWPILMFQSWLERTN